jgi:hypothetical protein
MNLPLDVQKNIFLGALDIIKDEKRWTQNSLARDANGVVCGALDPQAVCWCSKGALWKAAADSKGGVWMHYTQMARLSAEVQLILEMDLPHDNNFERIAAFNDTHDHSVVIEHWRKVGKAKGWL